MKLTLLALELGPKLENKQILRYLSPVLLKTEDKLIFHFGSNVKILLYFHFDEP